jgi:hypothetical protein
MATMTLAANAIAFTEIEWRSSAVVASANRAIVTIAKGSKLAFTHYRVLCSLKTLSSSERNLLDLFHSQDIIVALEQATSEQLRDIADKIMDSQSKTDQAIKTLQSMQLRYWAPIYAPILTSLHICCKELRSHAVTFLDDKASLIVLSKLDQRALLASLENPSEPNAALRGAFESR